MRAVPVVYTILYVQVLEVVKEFLPVPSFQPFQGIASLVDYSRTVSIIGASPAIELCHTMTTIDVFYVVLAHPTHPVQ